MSSVTDEYFPELSSFASILISATFGAYDRDSFRPRMMLALCARFAAAAAARHAADHVEIVPSDTTSTQLERTNRELFGTSIQPPFVALNTLRYLASA